MLTVIFVIVIAYINVTETQDNRPRNRNEERRYFIGGITVKLNYALEGYGIASLKSRGFIECAQKCLFALNCGSVNYEMVEGLCELKRYSGTVPYLQLAEFTFKPGNLFVLLEGWHVSHGVH